MVQYILSHVKAIIKQFDADKGAMTLEALDTVLKDERVERTAYYKRRSERLTKGERESLAKPFVRVSTGESVRRSKIMSFLTQDYGQDKAEVLFQHAEERRFASLMKGCYVIPIPSM